MKSKLFKEYKKHKVFAWTLCAVALGLVILVSIILFVGKGETLTCEILSKKTIELLDQKRVGAAVDQYKADQLNCVSRKSDVSKLNFEQKTKYIYSYSVLAKRSYFDGDKKTAKKIANTGIDYFMTMNQEQKNKSSTASTVSDLADISRGDY